MELEDHNSSETSKGVFKSLGIDPQAMNARREEKIRAALEEAAASLGIAATMPVPTATPPARPEAPELVGEHVVVPEAPPEAKAPAPPAAAKADSKAAPSKKMYLLHVGGRDFYTTEDSVETIKSAFAKDAVPIVQIMVRMIDERDPKPFQLIVNVNHIAFMRAT